MVRDALTRSRQLPVPPLGLGDELAGLGVTWLPVTSLVFRIPVALLLSPTLPTGIPLLAGLLASPVSSLPLASVPPGLPAVLRYRLLLLRGLPMARPAGPVRSSLSALLAGVAVLTTPGSLASPSPRVAPGLVRLLSPAGGRTSAVPTPVARLSDPVAPTGLLESTPLAPLPSMARSRPGSPLLPFQATPFAAAACVAPPPVPS